MATQVLLEKFNQIASNSKVFRLMSESDQALLLAGFQTASDEQLTEAIRSIEVEDQNLTVKEHEMLDQAKQQIELSEQLHAEIKNADRHLLAAKENDEHQSDVAALESMEGQLMISKDQKKPGKFLGLF